MTSIVSVITMITNTSLDEAVMPRPLKHAIVCPSLKKPSLDKDNLSNYRPVSNITQLSKVLEKVVALRIMTHVSYQQMVECFQSAYRKTIGLKPLLYVTSAIKTAMDNKQGTTLVLVDFSAAFDTINHDILIRRLRYIVFARADAANSNRWPIIEDNYSDGGCPARLCPWTTVRPAYSRHYSS